MDISISSYFCSAKKKNRAVNRGEDAQMSPFLTFYREQVKKRIEEAIQRQVESRNQLNWFNKSHLDINKKPALKNKYTPFHSQRIFSHSVKISTSKWQEEKQKQHQISQPTINTLRNTHTSINKLLKKVNMGDKDESQQLISNPFYKIQKRRQKMRVQTDSNHANQFVKPSNKSILPTKINNWKFNIKSKRHKTQLQAESISKELDMPIFQNTYLQKINPPNALSINNKNEDAQQRDRNLQEVNQTEILSPKNRGKSETVMYYTIKGYYQQKYGKIQTSNKRGIVIA